MKPLRNLLLILLLAGMPFAFLLAQSDNVTGTYKYQAGDAALTLKLIQQGNTLAGTLSSNTGASFSLSGQIENGIGYGSCSDNEGSVFFEVYYIERDLTLSLIEPDENNAPDYDNAQYLVFEKSKQSDSPQVLNNMTGKLGVQPAAIAGSPGNSQIGQGEVGDPSWGFKFTPPAGWVHQQSAEGVILGHNTIAGMILVIPHMSENMQLMQQEMMQGIQEGESSLAVSGALQNPAQNVLAGDYTGMMDGTEVKARGFGFLSPNGGGAYLIAVSTPDKLSGDLVGAAESIAQNMQYFKVDVSDLARHFAGTWSHFTTNTSTWMTFHPDGTYSDEYEDSYSGDLTDGWGNQTGDWGTAGQQSGRGRWTVRGTKDVGTIIVQKANGEEVYYEYRVNQKDGHKYYWEYYFNGDFYMKKEE